MNRERKVGGIFLLSLLILAALFIIGLGDEASDMEREAQRADEVRRVQTQAARERRTLKAVAASLAREKAGVPGERK